MLQCKFPACDYKHRHPHGIKQHEIVHSSDPKVRRPHECQFCDYRSGSKYKLKEHIVLHIEGKKFKCLVSGCGYRTHNKEYLRRHEKTHNLMQMSCDFEGCNYKSKYRPTLEAHAVSHYSSVVREKETECPMCSKRFENSTSMRTHLRSHTNEKPWRCSFCSYECKLKDSLNKHLETMHGELRLRLGKQLLQKCDLCDFTTTFSKTFRRHLASHSQERPFPCSFPGCSHRAKRKDSLTTHEKTHNPDEHRCPEPGCAHVSKSRGCLRSHQKMHNKQFNCVFPNCKREFLKEAGLLNHQRFHDPNREFACDQCPERFQKKITLVNHIKFAHSWNKEFRCPHCNFCTRFGQNLNQHLKNVHSASYIRCSELGCKYRSYSHYDVDGHARRYHDKIRPFKCQYCAYRFTRKGHLEEHRMKVHKSPKKSAKKSTLQKLFECEVCGAIFEDDLKLTKHSVFHRIASVILSRAVVQVL